VEEVKEFVAERGEGAEGQMENPINLTHTWGDGGGDSPEKQGGGEHM
jgi:hypothetical protein